MPGQLTVQSQMPVQIPVTSQGHRPQPVTGQIQLQSPAFDDRQPRLYRSSALPVARYSPTTVTVHESMVPTENLMEWMVMPGAQAVPSCNQSDNQPEVVEVTQDRNPQQMTGQYICPVQAAEDQHLSDTAQLSHLMPPPDDPRRGYIASWGRAFCLQGQ